MKIEEVQKIIARFAASLAGKKPTDITVDSLIYRDFLDTLAYAGCFDTQPFKLSLSMSKLATELGDKLYGNVDLLTRLRGANSKDMEAILQSLVEPAELAKEIRFKLDDAETKDRPTIEEVLAVNCDSQMELTNFFILSTQSLLLSKEDIDQSPLLSNLNAILRNSPERREKLWQKISGEVGAKDEDRKGLYYDMMCREYDLSWEEISSETKPTVVVLGSVMDLVERALQTVGTKALFQNCEIYMLSGNRPYENEVDVCVIKYMSDAIRDGKKDQWLLELEEDRHHWTQLESICGAVDDVVARERLTEADLMTGLTYLFNYHNNQKLKLINLETKNSSTGRKHVNTEDTIKTLLKLATVKGSKEPLVCVIGMSLGAISQHKQIRNALMEAKDKHRLAVMAPSTKELIEQYSGSPKGRMLILTQFLQNFAGGLYADYPYLAEPKNFDGLQVFSGECRNFDLSSEEYKLLEYNMAKRRLVSLEAIGFYDRLFLQ